MEVIYDVYSKDNKFLVSIRGDEKEIALNRVKAYAKRSKQDLLIHDQDSNERGYVNQDGTTSIT